MSIYIYEIINKLRKGKKKKIKCNLMNKNKNSFLQTPLKCTLWNIRCHPNSLIYNISIPHPIRFWNKTKNTLRFP